MQQSRVDERREFQRLQLEQTFPGTFGALPVTVTEIGILGARVRHDEPITTPRAELRFQFEGSEIVMRCEVVRTVGKESGIRFLAAVGDSGDRLRAMLASIVTRALVERGDNSATRLKLRKDIDGDKTVRGTDAFFVSYRLEEGGWKRRHVFLPEQPSSGFTVARGEDVDEMRRLCEVYEASDEEGRRLIRLFAELSVSSALRIPPRF